MNERTIRRPTGPATIFLIQAITYFFTIVSTILMTQLFDYPKTMEPLAILRFVLLGATNLFMSIVLFSKKYNNLLLVSTGALMIQSIFGLFLNITPYLISEIIFYLILIAFTYIVVKKPDTPIREKTVKFRFIIPVFQFILILISTIQTMQGLYENLTESMGTPLSDGITTAIALVPSILGAISGFLPVLCYSWLSNWLANPVRNKK